MKNRFLFPNKYKKIGWFLFIPSSIIGLLVLFETIEFGFLDIKTFAIYGESMPPGKTFFTLYSNNIADEILSILIIISGLFIAFSKEKKKMSLLQKFAPNL